MRNLICFALLLLFSWSCSHPSKKSKTDSKITKKTEEIKQSKDLLSQEDAIERYGMIKNIHYDLQFNFKKGKETYSGQVDIQFESVEITQNLFIDFNNGIIKSIWLNGKKLDDYKYDNFKVIIPHKNFTEINNTIRISFERNYSKEGIGLHKFIDPSDQEEYLYTNFEPYNANKLFPCFDQPDLKASYSLLVIAPKTWNIIANEQANKRDEIDENFSRWTFDKTKKFSTYIFALHAGPYHYWEDKYKEIPLKLYVRKSLIEHVDYENWFKITKSGFKFFENYFSLPYPFTKYDQILVPDFNWGAMENVGAVTFNDSRYVYRSSPTKLKKEERANTILHELAHMWFGNLVTMKWWNGLWLNESFASYMATLALYKETIYKDSWQTFYTDDKRWGYWQDGLVTTHPIETPVKDTAQAFSNFDGISYGKGGAVLKQLSYLIGRENFRKGVASYLKTYAYSNTKTTDFFNSLEKVSRRDLSLWKKNWIETAGHNIVALNFKCSQGVIDHFTIDQKLNNQVGVLRTHRIVISLFEKTNANKFEIFKELPVRFSGKKTYVEALHGQRCPDIAYPNFKDQGFFKVQLDKKSLEMATYHINEVNHVLTRNMLWLDLWEMVRKTQFSLYDYLKMFVTHIEYEKNHLILSSLIRTISRGALQYLLQAPEDSKNLKLRARLEKLFYTRLSSSLPESEMQKLWFDGFIRAVSTEWGLQKLENIYTNKIIIKGLEFDVERKWKLLTKLSEYGWKNVEDYIKKQANSEKSDKSSKLMLEANAALPEFANKEAWYKKIIENSQKDKLSNLKAIMNGLLPINQRENIMAFEKRFYDNLISLTNSRDQLFLDSYVSYLSPRLCDSKSNLKLEKFIDDHKNLPDYILRELKIRHQENKRCSKIINYETKKAE